MDGIRAEISVTMDPQAPIQTKQRQAGRLVYAWLACILLLILSICLWYPQVAQLKGSLLTGDHREQHYPWADFLAKSLAQGQLPWWTWGIHCGFPLLAEGQ